MPTPTPTLTHDAFLTLLDHVAVSLRQAHGYRAHVNGDSAGYSVFFPARGRDTRDSPSPTYYELTFDYLAGDVEWACGPVGTDAPTNIEPTGISTRCAGAVVALQAAAWLTARGVEPAPETAHLPHPLDVLSRAVVVIETGDGADEHAALLDDLRDLLQRMGGLTPLDRDGEAVVRVRDLELPEVR
jgi:hypothetical protein